VFSSRLPQGAASPERAGFEPAQRVYTHWTVSKPLPENNKTSQTKDLEQGQTGAYKPAYKENPKTGQNDPAPLPADLAEIVAVWPELPEHTKTEIKALIQTHNSNT